MSTPGSASRWVAPPNWPQPEPGWSPPPGWQPLPEWGAPPAGWQFWQQSPDAAPAKPWNKLGAAEKKAADPQRAKSETKKGLAVLAGIALLVAGCVAIAGGDEGGEDTVTTASDGAAEEPKEADNPLDTDDNELACKSARREVGERADVFEDVSNGTALPADAAKAAQELQKDTGDYSSFATGAIRTQLVALSDAYGRMRVTLTTGDIDGLVAAVAEQNTALTELDKLCTSIDE
jgi:hypothetical protein